MGFAWVCMSVCEAGRKKGGGRYILENIIDIKRGVV